MIPIPVPELTETVVLLLFNHHYVAEIFVDASSVGKRPTELAGVFAPEVQRGSWAPPLAGALRAHMSRFSQFSQECVEFFGVFIELNMMMNSSSQSSSVHRRF